MWPEPVPTTNSMLPSNPPSAKTVRPGCRHVRNKWTFLVYKEHLRDACSLEEKLWQKQRHHFADKGPDSQSYDFSSSHEWMWELNHKEDWAPKNWCFLIVVLESPLDCKEIKLVSLKGNPPWIFTGRTAAEVEAPITLVICCNELTLWKRALCWESLKAKEEGGGRGWDG